MVLPLRLTALGKMSTRASISHTRIPYDSPRITCKAAIDSCRAFSVSRDWRECATRRLLLIIFKWISVQDNSSGWGTEGSEGRWVRQACIGRSVILNYQVVSRQNIRWMLHPHTLPAAAGQCYSYIIAAYRTDGRCNVQRAWWGVCVWGAGGTGRCAYRKVGMSPSSPRSSLSHHTAPPRVAATHGGLSGAGVRTWCAVALAGHRRSTAQEDDAVAILRTVPSCN